MRIFITACIFSVFISFSTSHAKGTNNGLTNLLGSDDQFSTFSLKSGLMMQDSEVTMTKDSLNDSLAFDFTNGKFHFRRRRQAHNFLITEAPDDRISRYTEPFAIMDFNRVNGFFLGIGSSRYFSIGRYEEVGIKGGIGFGFAKSKGQSFLGAEYRIPLQTLQMVSGDTLTRRRFVSVPTLAIGGEYHNITTTEDYWRVGRIENAFDAFLAREDFRDYFSLEGFEAHLAFRPSRHDEARLEYRNDIYLSEDQRVFYGRFGGNKRLPINPAVTEGRFASYVVSYIAELTRSSFDEATTVFGDPVELETMQGTSYLVQAEFGNHISDSKTFNKYTVDIRRFQPIISGLNIDSRLRFESSTGDVPFQKAEFLGGPSSLPAYKNKVFAGNRMVLLNTEVRINLAILSTIFEHNGIQLLIKNDFGYVTTDTTNSPFAGIGKSGGPSVLFNPGIGIGSVSGGELGVSWRTDVSASPRFFFRFERPF